jgi:phosphatidylglycerophosphatase A
MPPQDLIDMTDVKTLPASEQRQAPRRASVRLLVSQPAHWLALGAGSGLSPVAPGTVGTLWAWLSFMVLQHFWGTGPMADVKWALLIGVGTVVGVWACTRTAQAMRVADPSAVVWDEIVAFWLVLWLMTPCSFWAQGLAFALFRYFDAAKPGPVAWADQLFKLPKGQAMSQAIGWRQGAGILLDDFVAAGCTLLVLAFTAPWWRAWGA